MVYNYVILPISQMINNYTTYFINGTTVLYYFTIYYGIIIRLISLMVVTEHNKYYTSFSGKVLRKCTLVVSV